MAATQEVKAWTYFSGYPHSLRQSTVHPPTPSVFRDDPKSPRLLVQIHACVLNPVDIQMMNMPSWNHPWNPLYGKAKGCVCDFSGTVLKGSSAGFEEGDEVFGITLRPFAPNGGALAEVADLNMGNTVVVTKPKEWSFEQASAISLVWLTAKACIDAVASFVDSSANKRVAILGGSSATGIYCIMLAKRKGWTIAATSSERNKDFVTSTLKADVHVDYTSQDVRKSLTEFAPDAVIDCVGGTECIGLPSSKRYITIVGDKTGRTSMGGPYTYYDYWAPHRAVPQWWRWWRGSKGWGESYDVVILGMKKDWLEEAKQTLRSGDIYIDSTFAFDQAKEAFERLNTGRARGKVVIKVR